MAEQILTVDEWIDKLLADAPPITDEQREFAVRMLAMPPQTSTKPTKQPRSTSRRAA